MSNQPVGIQSSPSPEMALPAEPTQRLNALAEARRSGDVGAARAIVRDAPRSLFAWAAVGELEAETMAKYAAFRVGYHRGLDALRANGWRGAGRVPRTHPENHGFLDCLRGLGAMASAIGEADEADRIATFLTMLDPHG